MNATKLCRRCSTTKPRTEFYRRTDRPHCCRPKCKACERKLNREWQIKNRERVNANARNSYWRNPQRSVEYSRKWRLENPEKKRKQRVIERAVGKTRPETVIKWRLRDRINKALRGNWKFGDTIILLGCSISDFKIYLESRFEPDMSWSNQGRGGWHIDHIIPCALFDLTKAEHQKRCFHFSNMQPMWESENCAKGCRVIS